jgi:hypothetical protein
MGSLLKYSRWSRKKPELRELVILSEAKESRRINPALAGLIPHFVQDDKTGIFPLPSFNESLKQVGLSNFF